MDSTHPETQEIFDDAAEKFGFVPNVIQEMAKSPVAAKLYLKAQEYLAQGALTPQEQQAAQLAVAKENECNYCTAAHTVVGKMVGIGEDELCAIGKGQEPADPALIPVVKATRLLIEKKGWLDENDLQTLEGQGIDRTRLYEIIVLMALKMITNYVNHIAHTPIDPELKQ